MSPAPAVQRATRGLQVELPTLLPREDLRRVVLHHPVSLANDAEVLPPEVDTPPPATRTTQPRLRNWQRDRPVGESAPRQSLEGSLQTRIHLRDHRSDGGAPPSRTVLERQHQRAATLPAGVFALGDIRQFMCARVRESRLESEPDARSPAQTGQCQVSRESAESHDIYRRTQRRRDTQPVSERDDMPRGHLPCDVVHATSQSRSHAGVRHPQRWPTGH